MEAHTVEGTRFAKSFVLVLFIYSSNSMADNETYSTTSAITSNEATEVPSNSTSIQAKKNVTEVTTKGDNNGTDAPIKADSTTTITITTNTLTTTTEDTKPTTSTEDNKPTTVTEDNKPS